MIHKDFAIDHSVGTRGTAVIEATSIPKILIDLIRRYNRTNYHKNTAHCYKAINYESIGLKLLYYEFRSNLHLILALKYAKIDYIHDKIYTHSIQRRDRATTDIPWTPTRRRRLRRRRRRDHTRPAATSRTSSPKEKSRDLWFSSISSQEKYQSFVMYLIFHLERNE